MASCASRQHLPQLCAGAQVCSNGRAVRRFHLNVDDTDSKLRLRLPSKKAALANGQSVCGGS